MLEVPVQAASFPPIIPNEVVVAGWLQLSDQVWSVNDDCDVIRNIVITSKFDTTP